MHVLLTGGSGFIAHHVLNTLLAHGHTVTTTVRSEEKAQKVRSASAASPSTLSFAIVPDMAVADAFDSVVRTANPGFDAVIHTASPFTFNVTDFQKELLDPAVIGTTGILRSVQRYGPSVKQVVITSSFAAIVDPNKGLAPGYVYSEKDWSPVTEEEAMASASGGYRASKTFAERAAWEFVEREKPGFTLTTLNPPLVLGPIEPKLQGLESLNTSNQRIRDIVQGKAKEKIPETGTLLWVDVRDLADAHVRAIETPDAAGKRFFTTAGYFSNKEIANIVRENFPALADKLPGKEVKGGDYPEGEFYKFDNSRSEQVLGMKWRTLERSIVDTVDSLQAAGA